MVGGGPDQREDVWSAALSTTDISTGWCQGPWLWQRSLGHHGPGSPVSGLVSLYVMHCISNAGESHAQETCTRNLNEKFDNSSSQFLAPIQLSPTNCVARFVSPVGQFLCWNWAVLNCVQEICTRDTREKTCTRLTDTLASFFYRTICTSLWYKFLERASPA